ncbi:uncharacterized protein J3D65DRAFT_149984 [Phyllosticta citribraziliensis]|uniref:Uncharacterized protein n=1 Tax=Phyllosticta citribraziliensis TaxID=989973 RepID=A0ABR1L4P9_9PEZI
MVRRRLVVRGGVAWWALNDFHCRGVDARDTERGRDMMRCQAGSGVAGEGEGVVRVSAGAPIEGMAWRGLVNEHMSDMQRVGGRREGASSQLTSLPAVPVCSPRSNPGQRPTSRFRLLLLPLLLLYLLRGPDHAITWARPRPDERPDIERDEEAGEQIPNEAHSRLLLLPPARVFCLSPSLSPSDRSSVR